MNDSTQYSDIITTEYGKVSGIHKNGCVQYLGIPFAKPPVNELAFRHPVRPEKWEGVRDGSFGRANPVQTPGGFEVNHASEDCLYLNVFVPENAEGVLPVMVWIYGGSYANGGSGAVSPGSSTFVYDFATFAKETNTIVVSFNYRLNLYGFLNLHFLSDRFENNCGLSDQIMALRFVKENIAYFGGDPAKVTVFGQSAGGACILALMSISEAEGLFSAAIVQSACAEHFYSEEESEENTRLYMKAAHVKDVEGLMHLGKEEARKANGSFTRMIYARGELRCAFSPVIDGVTLKEAPIQAAQKSTIPLLIGNTSQEGNLFLQKIPSAALPAVAKYMHLKVENGKEPFRKRTCDALTRHIYVRPLKTILSGYQGPAWRYEYRYAASDCRTVGLGCFHTAELPVLFDMANPWEDIHDPVTQSVGRKMRHIWSTFAYERNPGWGLFKETKEIYGIDAEKK